MSRYSLGVFAEKTDVKPQMVELPKCWKVTIIIIALIAIAALVIAICKSFPRLDLGFDYMGVIVAIFSTIVTLLLGWQIYNLFDIKSIAKDNDERKKDYEALKIEFENYKSFHDAQILDVRSHSLFIQERYVGVILYVIRCIKRYGELEYKGFPIRESIFIDCLNNWLYAIEKFGNKNEKKEFEKKEFREINQLLKTDFIVLKDKRYNEVVEEIKDLMKDYESHLDLNIERNKVERIRNMIPKYDDDIFEL